MNANRSILHIVNGEFYAGAERVQDLLALSLPDFGYEISFACLKHGIFAAKRQSSESELFEAPMSSQYDFRPAFSLAKRIKTGNFRAVHTHSPRAALLGQAASVIAGVPMIHHVHSPSDRDTEQGWRNRRNSAVERFSLLRATSLIAVSNSLKNYLLDKGYSDDRVQVVSNGVPMMDKNRLAYDRSGPLTVGMIALFRPRKGIEVLLQSLAELKQQGHQVRLHAVGPFETAEYHAEILALTTQLGLENEVHWTGFTSDVAAEFQHMNVFVLPSLFGEGMPMVVLEAMAAGLPVVSTLVEGIPEVVRDGREGLLTEPNSSAALSMALANILEGKVNLEELGDAGWQRQRDGFSDAAMARSVASVYDSVLAT